MSSPKYEVVGVSDGPCPFCSKKSKPPVFQVTGPYTGLACAAHLATLISQTKPEDDKPNLYSKTG